MRILVVRPDKLGDLLAVTPLCRALKQEVEAAHLTVWIRHGMEEVLRRNPDVDAVGHTLKKPRFAELAKLARQYRKGRFETAVFVRRDGGNHVIAARLAGVRRRIGATRKWYGALLTHNLKRDWDEARIHVCEQALRLGEAAIGRELPRLPMRFMPDLDDRFDFADLEGGFFVVHPGTGGTARRWPRASYAQVAKALCEETGLEAVFTGNEGERELCEQVRQQSGGGLVMAGNTTLSQLALLLGRARLMVAGSTGVLHLGASQGTPCVLVEPTPDAELRVTGWKPWMVPSFSFPADIVCDGCAPDRCHRRGRDCVESISVGKVVAGCRNLLGSGTAELRP